MKKLFIFILFIFSLILTNQSVNARVSVAGYIKTIGNLDVYPTHIDSLQKGGYRIVEDETIRDAITPLRRKIGMLVYSQKTDILYILKPDITNASWTVFSTGKAATTINGLTLTPLPTGFTIAGGIKTSQMLTLQSDAMVSGINTGDQTTISGNAATATALQTGRTLSISGDVTYTSPLFDGSADITQVGTLATVNTNVGTYGSATLVPQFTVNAKGLVTAVSNIAITPPDASVITGGKALTVTDDANVTLTLGGSPLTSLLAATILKLGWSGTLADDRIASAAIWTAKQNSYPNLSLIGSLADGTGWLKNSAGVFTYSNPSPMDIGLSNVTNNAQIYSLNGITGLGVQTFAIGTIGIAPNWISINNTTNTHSLNIPMASVASVTAGLLSNSDWTNFNTAYTNRITNITNNGSTGPAKLSENVLNIPNYGTQIGPTGSQGIQGPTGNTGSAGSAGSTGPQGPTGNTGSAGSTGSQGPTGNTGSAGSTGPQGPTGNTGSAGSTGPQGPTGNTGSAGSAGSTGPQGPTGATGTFNGTEADPLSLHLTGGTLSALLSGTSASFTSTVTAADCIATSDIRLKKNIHPLQNVSESLRKINAVEFDRRDIKLHQIGFIAQNVQKYFPALVHTAKDSMSTLSLSYQSMTSPLLKGWQEHDELITKQQKEIDELKKELELLKKSQEELKKLINSKK
jgi:hypothetical protein